MMIEDATVPSECGVFRIHCETMNTASLGLLAREMSVEQLRAILGQVCQNFRLVAGGSLIIYLGHHIDEQELTDWRLHVDTAWRLDGPIGPLVGSLDACCDGRPPEWVFEALMALVCQSVESVAVGSPVCELAVNFTGGYRLLTFSHCVFEEDGWELRHKTGQRVVAKTATMVVAFMTAPD
jgi:hypothetical protein